MRDEAIIANDLCQWSRTRVRLDTRKVEPKNS